MTRSESAAGATLVEPSTTETTTPQQAPPRRMRSFWPLVAVTGAVLAFLITWAVLEVTSVEEIVDDRAAVPARPESSTVYGRSGEIPGAFLPGGLPQRDAGTYGSGGEVPESFAPDPAPGGGSYGGGGEIPDTFAPGR